MASDVVGHAHSHPVCKGPLIPPLNSLKEGNLPSRP